MATWAGTFDLNCRLCTEQDKIENGCEAESSIPGAWKLYDWEFQRCPLKLITSQSIDYLKAYGFYNKGYLPNAGTWMDQPAKFIEAMGIIEREVTAIQESEARKIKEKGSKS